MRIGTQTWLKVEPGGTVPGMNRLVEAELSSNWAIFDIAGQTVDSRHFYIDEQGVIFVDTAGTGTAGVTLSIESGSATVSVGEGALTAIPVDA